MLPPQVEWKTASISLPWWVMTCPPVSVTARQILFQPPLPEERPLGIGLFLAIQAWQWVLSVHTSASGCRSTRAAAASQAGKGVGPTTMAWARNAS